MDWLNERYVRLYCRDTTTMRRIGWLGRAVLAELLRKVDSAGVLDLEDMTPVAATVLHCELPPQIAADGLVALIMAGTIEIRGRRLFLPNFRDAQEANKSDKARQRASREKRAAIARTAELSQDVTTGRSLPLQLSLSEARSLVVGSQLVTPCDGGEIAGVTIRDKGGSSATTDVTPRDMSHDSRHGFEENYTLLQCSAQQSNAQQYSAEQSGGRPSQNVTDVVTDERLAQVYTFAPPLPPEPPDLPPLEPPLERWILLEHSRRYADAFAAVPRPTAKSAEHARVLAAFCADEAPGWGLHPQVLASKCLDGLFADSRAYDRRYPLGFAAYDPAQYLPPRPGSKPRPLTKSSRRTINQAPAEPRTAFQASANAERWLEGL